jgi:tetratricopeptide (TPR) repeat protein
MHQDRFSEAATILDELINKQKDHIAAWVLRGHAYYFNDNLFDSEESYIKALRLNPQLDDSILQERLGIVYIKRKAWKDARTVFLKCCKESTRFVSWAYLGYCLLKLGELA